MTRARSPLSEAVFWSVPVVLFLPALYYSLTTPFGLVDDYFQAQYASFLAGEFTTHPERYRPFWDFYNGVTWTIFGPVPWLHHLARWLMVAGAVFFFTAAFSVFPSVAQTGGGAASGFLRLLPRALLVYLWVFFPNQPAARLGPQEVNTVFFMGLCTWMMARMLSRRGRGEKEEIRSTRLTHGLFVLGCLGLVWSKEVNIALALWMLVFYCGPLLKRMDRPRILGSLALVAVFVHTAWTISGLYAAGGYGTGSVTLELVTDNAGWIAASLFQVDTSPVIASGLVLLLALLPVFVVAKARSVLRARGTRSVLRARGISSELLFVLFLLGQFASLYLILCTSWMPVIRYWYSLVPVFTALVAFSAKFMLELVAQPAWSFGSAHVQAVQASRARLGAACALAGFVLFFISCNYSNMLLQTVVQHRARHAERELLAEITRLLDRGRHVTAIDFSEVDELVYNILNYYRDFLPRFHGRKYDIHDKWTDTALSRRAGEPRYWVISGGDLPASYEIVDGYRLLSWAHDVATVLQLDTPYWNTDAGVGMRNWYVASTDPSYGRNGLMQVGPEGLHEPAGDLVLDARFDNSISRYIREHSIAGLLFSNDISSVSHIHGHDSAVQIYEELPCVGSGPIGALRDVHIAWFFNGSSRQEYTACADFDALSWELTEDSRAIKSVVESAQSGVNMIKVALNAGPIDWRGPWRWQRAVAMPDDPRRPDDSTWSDVDGERSRSWQYALTLDDEGQFFRAHVEYEKEGELTRAESAVMGPIVVGLAVHRGMTTMEMVDLWKWPGLELVAKLDAGLIFRMNKSGISPFQARYEQVATSGEPIIDDLFDVYLHDGELTYLKGDGCNAEMTLMPFFLHVVPFSTMALPPWRKEFGFDAFSFDFDQSGLMSNGKCFLTVPFPDYAVRSIGAGQWVPGQDQIWAGYARWDE